MEQMEPQSSTQEDRLPWHLHLHLHPSHPLMSDRPGNCSCYLLRSKIPDRRFLSVSRWWGRAGAGGSFTAVGQSETRRAARKGASETFPASHSHSAHAR